MGSQKNTTMRIKSDANLSSSSTRSFISSEGDVRDELAETFDTAIELAEFGWFHLLVLLVCGSTFLSVTLVPNVLTYMRDDVGCNLGLSLQDKSTTNHLTYTGMIAGTFICGILADLFGRRTTLVGILLVNSLSSMCTSMVNKATSFEVCRFFSSFSTAGSMVVAITYLAELHPPRNRGAAISCMQIFWVVGTIVFQAMFLSWRFLVGLSVAPPILLVLVIVTFLPESPRYLLTRGKVRLTLKALQTIFAMNTGMQRDKYPVKMMKDNDKLAEMRYYMEETLIPAYMKPRCYSIPILLMSQFCLMFGKLQVIRTSDTDSSDAVKSDQRDTHSGHKTLKISRDLVKTCQRKC